MHMEHSGSLTEMERAYLSDEILFDSILASGSEYVPITPVRNNQEPFNPIPPVPSHEGSLVEGDPRFPLIIVLDFKLGKKKDARRFDTNGVTSAILRKLGKPGAFPRAYNLMVDSIKTSRISCTPALGFFNTIHTLNPPPDQDAINEYYAFRSCYRAVLDKYFNLTENHRMKKILTPTPGEDEIKSYVVEATLGSNEITIRRIAYDGQKRKTPPVADDVKQVRNLTMPRQNAFAPTGPYSKRPRTQSAPLPSKCVKIAFLLHLKSLPQTDNEGFLLDIINGEKTDIEKALKDKLGLKTITLNYGPHHEPKIVFENILTASSKYLEQRSQGGGQGDMQIALSIRFPKENFYRDNQQDLKRCLELQEMCVNILKALNLKWSRVKTEEGSIICTFAMAARELEKVRELHGAILEEFKKPLIDQKIKCMPTVSTTSTAKDEVKTPMNENQPIPRSASVRIEATCTAGVCIINKLLDLSDWKTEKLHILKIHAFPMYPHPLTNKNLERLGDCLPAIQDLIRTLRGVFTDPFSNLESGILAHIVEYWAFDVPPPKMNPSKEEKNAMEEIFESVGKGELEVLKGLIRDHPGAKINQKDSEGRTALHIACKKGKHAIARVLVDSKANLEARDRQKNTGLQIVCRKGNLEITKLLVESKAQLDGSDNRGTPLLASCRWGNLAVVRYLVRAGANVKVTDAKGYGPLHLAVEVGNPSTVKFLTEEAKPDVNATNTDGLTALHMACLSLEVEIARLLLESKANLEATEADRGFTPLLASCSKGHLPLVRCLVEAKADAKAVDRFGQGPLHLAATAGDLLTVKYLVENAKANVNATNNQGHTAVGVAVKVVENDRSKKSSLEHPTALNRVVTYLRSCTQTTPDSGKNPVTGHTSKVLGGDVDEASTSSRARPLPASSSSGNRDNLKSHLNEGDSGPDEVRHSQPTFPSDWLD
ncbi:hypothetical protein AAMO2058_001743400 [Amorphochlora amoebiformis]